ncbi:MAG TPA: ATP cone domain-containing protein, partial [Deinococcales bacterium]|nr:ATP cone domain-containing protein [Deinococcales bacterium]
EKRPVSADALRNFAFKFEDEVNDPEISSEEIGRRAMLFLRPLDDVAYIRFASVYRDFENVQRFIQEIQELRDAPVEAAAEPER